MTENQIEMLRRLYRSFNERNIDDILSALADGVAWANGMDGGFVHGREAVGEYWTRQWAVVSPHVEPVGFSKIEDGSFAVTVIQNVFDLEGKPLEGQSHGLHDKTLTHIFHMKNGKIVRFDIGEEV